MNLADYQVTVADWAIPPHVVAFEHKRADGKFCLLASTTVALDLSEMTRLAAAHTCKEKR